MNFKRVYIIEPVGGHGGMDLYDYGQSFGLTENGFSVTLCTCDETIEKDLHLVRTVYSFGKIWQSNKIGKAFRFFQGYRKAYKAAKRDQAAIVHFHFFQIGWLNWAVLQMARFYPFKKVITIHDVDPFVNTAGKHLHQKIVRLADAVVVHNHFSRKELIQKGIEESKIHVIPHGNYCQFIERLPARTPTETLEILFFGQIKTVKGLDILLEALALVIQQGASVRLTIAGRPWRADWKKFEDLIRERDLSDHLELRLEYIPNEAVSDLFLHSDLVILPYRRIYQSGVLLLTMSYGRPCLTSDLEPFKEVIREGENGMLFKDGDSEDLANQLLHAARNKEALEKIRLGAIETISVDCDWKLIGKQLGALYEQLYEAEKND